MSWAETLGSIQKNGSLERARPGPRGGGGSQDGRRRGPPAGVGQRERDTHPSAPPRPRRAPRLTARPPARPCLLQELRGGKRKLRSEQKPKAAGAKKPKAAGRAAEPEEPPPAAPEGTPQTSWRDIAAAIGLAADSPWEEVAEQLLKVRMAGAAKYDYKGQIEKMKPYIKQMRAALKHTLLHAEVTSAEAEHKLREKEEEVRAALAHCEGLEEEAERLNGELAAELGEKEVQTGLRLAAEAEVEAKAAEVARARAEAEARGAELAACRAALEERAAQLAKAQTYSESLQAFITKLQDEATAASADLAGLRAEKAGLAEDVATLKGRNAGLEMQLGTAQASLRETGAAKAAALEEVSLLKEEHASVKGYLEQELKAEAAKASEVQGRLLGEKAELSEEIALLKGNAAVLEGKIGGLETQLSELEAAKAALAANCAALRTDLGEAKADFESKAAAQRQEAADAAAAFAAERATLAAARDEAAQRAEAVGTKLVEAETYATTLEMEKHALQEVAEKLKEQVAGFSAQLAAQKEQIAALEAKLEATESGLENATRELRRYEDATGSTAEEMANLASKSAALENQNASQNEIMAQMQQQFTLVQTKLNVLEQEKVNAHEDSERLKRKIDEMAASLRESEAKLAEGEAIRRKMHNTIQELKGNIRVFCRVRLKNAEEVQREAGKPDVFDFITRGEQAGTGLNLHLRTAKAQATDEATRYAFNFDKTFGPATGQEEVFEEVSQLVQSALDGYKVCIFAYGQTGSGKTHTMFGNAGSRGLIPRSLEQIFKSTRELEEEQGWEFKLKASMLEVYNEAYKDLLGSSLPEGKQHSVKHDAHGNTEVTFLTEFEVGSQADAERLIESSLSKRSVAATKMNSSSSRSHSVFVLKVHGRNRQTQQTIAGVLNLIDLAGSERLSRSGAKGQQLKEAQNINKSLSALGDVISSIATKESHIPYRNSKLTWLLQPCLGGDAKTLMVVNVAPSSASAQESLCSLRFAAKVNACEVGTAKPKRK